MQIQIDGEDLLKAAEPGSPAQRIIRSAAYFLLAAIGDLPEETEIHAATGADLDKLALVPTGTTEAQQNYDTVMRPIQGNHASVPAPPPPPLPSSLASLHAEYAASLPPPPPPPMAAPDSDDDEDDEDEGSNMGNVPPPPPTVVPPVTSSATLPTTAPLLPAATVGASSALAAVPTPPVNAEVDSVGMPYDERIHQKSKNKKKNGEWKLIKGIEEKSPGLVQSVTAELAARRGSLPPTSTHAGSNTVPLPPVSNGAGPSGVPAPNGVGASVPVPPPPPAGVVGSASPYRALIDKITDLTRAQKLAPSKVAEICQTHGAPSLMALNNMQHLIPNIDKDIDAAALGLM